MQLSDAQKKMVAQLRKREASLIRWRWAGALGALGYLGIGVFSMVAALHFLREPDLNAALVLSLLVPMTLGATGVGTAFGVYIFLRWNGRPETQLLLKLIEESEKNDD
jgi:hypothetical protein